MVRKGKGRKLETGEYYDSKNNRYMFQKMIDGERFTITASTLNELREQKNEFLCRIDKGNRLNTRNARMSLDAYFDFWFETFAKSGRKATTCTNYKSYYGTHIRNTVIGKKAISKITKADLQRIINEMAEEGKARSTMQNLRSCLNTVFECAVDDDIILKNPAKNVQIPQAEKKQRGAIEQEQLSIFMTYVDNNSQYSQYYPAFVTLFNLGLRIGELAALTWDDVDFKNNTVSVNKIINRYRKADYGFTMAVASPKSKTSIRDIPMNSIVKTELLKLRMKNTISTASLPLVDDSGRIKGEIKGFVFVNSCGGVWNEPCFRKLIKRIIDRQNRDAEKNNSEKLNDFCPHMARHIYTSLAYSAGADVKIVSQILGHASATVTLDTYTHLTEQKRQEQEKVINTIKIS